MDLVLGIDLGTSYFKLGLFDKSGDLRGLGRVAAATIGDGGSLCELAVESFWSALGEALSAALSQANAGADDIRAISYSSQANSFVLLDARDEPLTPLILWPDRRVADVAPSVRRLWQRDDFVSVTGLAMPCGNEWAVAKLRWLQQNRPDLWRRVQRVMTISDYLVFSLTGLAVGDEGTASLLGMWNLPHHHWWDVAVEAAGIRPGQLSQPLRPGTLAGPTSAEGASRLPLPAGIPLAVGSLDHHAAAIGAGVGPLAELSESTGTVLACLHLTDEFSPMADCCMGPAATGDGYYQLAFHGHGASVLEWYRQRFAEDLSIPQLVSLAEDVPPGSDGLIALPLANEYPGLEGFHGAGADHGHGHFARAILESTAAIGAALAERLCGGELPSRIAATGGGAKSDLWLQIKADVLGSEFVTSTCPEPACLGAGIFAAAACNWFDGIDSAEASWVRIKHLFKPNPASHDFYAKWRKAYAGATA